MFRRLKYVFPLFAALSCYVQASVSDSLLILLENSKGLERARLLYHLAEGSISSDTVRAAAYLNEAQGIVDKKYDDEVQAYIWKFRAEIAELSNEVNALEYLRRASELFQVINHYHEIGLTCRKIGIYYFHMGNYDKSLSYFVLSQRAFEKEGYEPGIAAVENNLGSIDYTLGNKEDAERHYLKALEYYRKNHDSVMICKVNANLGNIYNDNGDYKKALSMFNEAFSGFLVDSNYVGMASTYNNIALVYYNQKDTVRAVETLKKSIEFARKDKSGYFLAISLNNLGSFYNDMKMADSASRYLAWGLQIADSLGFRDIHQELLIESARQAELKGDYKKAYHYQVEAFKLEEDIYNLQVTAKIAELSVSHQQELREKEFDRIRSQKETQSLLNKIFVLLLVLTIALILLTRHNLRQNKRANAMLTEKNDQLNDINCQLKASEEALRLLNNSKDRLFSIVAHDLRNPIAAVSGFTELLSGDYDTLDDAARKEYIQQIIQGVQRTQTLLENLLIWSRSQMKAIAYKPDFHPVCALLDESLKPLKASLTHKKVSLKKDCAESFDLYADRDMVLTMFRNLITNAVKFSFPGGVIELRISKDAHFGYIEIEDHGIGIQPEIQAKLLDKSSMVHSTPGTSGESGSGLGLAICLEFAELNKGTITLESVPGKGSTFKVKLPLDMIAT